MIHEASVCSEGFAGLTLPPPQAIVDWDRRSGVGFFAENRHSSDEMVISLYYR